jgi:putative acetyltransferase
MNLGKCVMPTRQLGTTITDRRSRAVRALPQRLRIRPRSKGDSEGLWRLFNQEQFKRFGMILAPFDSPEDVEAWLDRIGSGNLEVVGTVDGAVVAFTGLYPLGGRQSHIGWISLGVHDEFQGRGIGTVLLKLILDSADVLAGLSRIQLNVFTDNERAIALYHSFGFRIEGRHESFACRDGAYVDAFTMARLNRQPAAARTTAEIVSLFRQLQPSPQNKTQE